MTEQTWTVIPQGKPGVTLEIAHYHLRSSDHRPQVTVQVHHDGRAIHLHYTVHDDRYVLARFQQAQDPVCRDSCVEMFIQPVLADGSTRGYCNFEFNPLGTMLASHILDHTRTASGFTRFNYLDAALMKQVCVTPSLHTPMPIEHPGPLTWSLQVVVPVTVLEACVGPLGDLSGQRFRANFYKCADDSSHPHWTSWAPIGEKLDFHVPEHFGVLAFA